MSSPFQRQHLISKVLLGRFVDIAPGAARKLHELRRCDPHAVRSVGWRVTGRHDWFIGEDAARSEAIWSRAETEFGNVVQELDDSRQIPSRTLGDAIKNLMALHIVRSWAANHMWAVALANAEVDQRVASIVTPDSLASARESGIYDASLPDAELVKAIKDGFSTEFRHGGALFAEILHEQYENTSRFFRDTRLEIAHFVENDLVLADVPCVTWNAKNRTAGLIAGVPIFQADAIVMPLGPHVIGSISTSVGSDLRIILDSNAANELNSVASAAAIHSVYFRPGANVERVVRSVWDRQNERPDADARDSQWRACEFH